MGHRDDARIRVGLAGRQHVAGDDVGGWSRFHGTGIIIRLVSSLPRSGSRLRDSSDSMVLGSENWDLYFSAGEARESVAEDRSRLIAVFMCPSKQSLERIRHGVATLRC